MSTNADPMRVLAESAILRYIGELNGESQLRYREVNLALFPDLDGVLEFENFASVTVDQVAFIRNHWISEKMKHPELDPKIFAHELATKVFAPVIEFGDENATDNHNSEASED